MKWFDWLLTPDNARKLSDELGYVLPVDEAMDNLSEGLKSNDSIMLSDEKLKTMYFMQPTPAKTTKITNRVWNAMKTDSSKIKSSDVTEDDANGWD